MSTPYLFHFVEGWSWGGGRALKAQGRSKINDREKIENGKEGFMPYFCFITKYK